MNTTVNKIATQTWVAICDSAGVRNFTKYRNYISELGLLTI